MVFNEDAERYKLLKNFIFPSHRINKYSTIDRYSKYQKKELLHIPFILDDNHKSVYPVLVSRFGNTQVDKSPTKYYKDFLLAFNREEGRYFFEKNKDKITVADILSSL